MPVLNMRQVDIQLRELAELPAEVIDRTKRAVAFDVLNEAIKRTPVEFGAARAAWNASSGSPKFVEVPNREKRTVPAPDPRILMAAVREGKPFEAVYITNGQSYIVPLDEGHSQQAPAGMTAGTLDFIDAKYGG